MLLFFLIGVYTNLVVAANSISKGVSDLRHLCIEFELLVLSLQFLELQRFKF